MPRSAGCSWTPRQLVPANGADGTKSGTKAGGDAGAGRQNSFGGLDKAHCLGQDCHLSPPSSKHSEPQQAWSAVLPVQGKGGWKGTALL